VGGAGAVTPDDAFNGKVSLDATVTAMVLSTQNVTIDPPHTLELDSTVALLPYYIAPLDFGVISTGTAAWTIDATNLTNGATASKTNANTLRITKPTANPSMTAEIDCGYIDILSDNMKYKLKVVQAINPEYWPAPHTGWAGCNIYYDAVAGHLTFDGVGDRTHEQYQGVYFQWGSLWGISPLGNWSGTTILYPPGGGSGTAISYGYTTWNSAPHIPDDSIPGSNSPERHYLGEIHNPASGIGDICKYLTDQGWAPAGNWRMPTSNEFETQANYSAWTAGVNAAANAQGTAAFASGRTKNDTSTSTTPFYPAAGVRIFADGTLANVGTYGYYRSATVYGINAWGLVFSNTVMATRNSNNRTYGFSVRCVRE